MKSFQICTQIMFVDLATREIPVQNINHYFHHHVCPSSLSYRTRANKWRANYSKIIFWEIAAANNQERLQFKNYFLSFHIEYDTYKFRGHTASYRLI